MSIALLGPVGDVPDVLPTIRRHDVWETHLRPDKPITLMKGMSELYFTNIGARLQHCCIIIKGSWIKVAGRKLTNKIGEFDTQLLFDIYCLLSQTVYFHK